MRLLLHRFPVFFPPAKTLSFLKSTPPFLRPTSSLWLVSLCHCRAPLSQCFMVQELRVNLTKLRWLRYGWEAEQWTLDVLYLPCPGNNILLFIALTWFFFFQDILIRLRISWNVLTITWVSEYFIILSLDNNICTTYTTYTQSTKQEELSNLQAALKSL